jgi:hypothetical protein
VRRQVTALIDNIQGIAVMSAGRGRHASLECSPRRLTPGRHHRHPIPFPTAPRESIGRRTLR